MPISRDDKQLLIDEYTDKVKRSQAAYITDYRGLSVAEIGDFRAELRKETTAELAVAKNTLLGIAFQNAGWAVPEVHLEGPTAVIFCYDDPVTPAKIMNRYLKRNDKITLKGAVMGQSIMDSKQAASMADLPSRDEVRATIIGLLNGPAQSLLGVLTAPAREIAQVLHAYGEPLETPVTE